MANSIDWIVINGVKYDKITAEVEENFNILYTENTQRTLDVGTMLLDTIGSFTGHKITFFNRTGEDALYNQLWDLLRTPTNEGINVSFPDGNSTISYLAYVSSGNRKLITIKNDKPKWDKVTFNFIPIKATQTIGG